MKLKQVTCRCPAYAFPHRLDSLKCKELYDSGSDETYAKGYYKRVDVDDYKFVPHDTRF